MIPAPWKASHDSHAWRVDEDTPHGQRVLAYNIAEKDANLIAAAPDLLAALQTLMGDANDGMKWSDRGALARAAIAKATRNTPITGPEHDWPHALNQRQPIGDPNYRDANLKPGQEF